MTDCSHVVSMAAFLSQWRWGQCIKQFVKYAVCKSLSSFMIKHKNYAQFKHWPKEESGNLVGGDPEIGQLIWQSWPNNTLGTVAEC